MSSMLLPWPQGEAEKRLLLQVRLASAKRYLGIPAVGLPGDLAQALCGAQALMRAAFKQHPVLALRVAGQSAVVDGLLGCAPADPAYLAIQDVTAAVLVGLSNVPSAKPAGALEVPLRGSVLVDPLRRIVVVTGELHRLRLDHGDLHIEYEPPLLPGGSPSAERRTVTFAPGSRRPIASAEGASILLTEECAFGPQQPWVGWCGEATPIPYPLLRSERDPDGTYWLALEKAWGLLTRWMPSWPSWAAVAERLEVDRQGALSTSPAAVIPLGAIRADLNEDPVLAAEAVLHGERRNWIRTVAATSPLLREDVSAQGTRVLDELIDLVALAAVVAFQDWFCRTAYSDSVESGGYESRFRARHEQMLGRLRDGMAAIEPRLATTPLGGALVQNITALLEELAPAAVSASLPAAGRVLFVNLDFADFVYSHLFGQSVLAACSRRNLAVDLLAVHPYANRDLAFELGVARSRLEESFDGTLRYFEHEDLSDIKGAIDRLLTLHRYRGIILNCRAPLFIDLAKQRRKELLDAHWLVYDRHLHEELEPLTRDAETRTAVSAHAIYLFTLQHNEICGGGLKILLDAGLSRERIYMQPWPIDETFFVPEEHPAPVSNEFTIFSGGDSGRDYETLFSAVQGLPIRLRLATGIRSPHLPESVSVLPRLPLHAFRDEVRRATVIVMPLSGNPQVSGLTVVAMAMAMGKPVIATDLPPARQYIRPGNEAGYLAPLRDPTTLRAQLERLLHDPAERQRLAAAARAVALREFGLATFTERLMSCDEAGDSTGSTVV